MITQSQKIRISIVFFCFCVLYGAIAFNLFLIQIKSHDFFSTLARQQYVVNITQKPPRALILDRTGSQMLAHNTLRLSAFIIPGALKDSSSLEPFLAKHFPQALEQLHKKRTKKFMYIKRHLNQQEIDLIKNANIPDINLLSEPHRNYPVASAATIIGLTDIDNNGLFGIELAYNDILAGTPTRYQLERDARSGHFYFKKEACIEGKEGSPIQLTIDANLQFLVDQEVKNHVETLNAQEGAAIIMNPQTGEILAMTSVPHFDPKDITHLNLETTKNKVITETYELGSVIKVCAALAALEEGVVSADELIDCKGCLTTYIDGRKINTTHPHGIIPFSQVIAKSNNIGTAIVAKRINTALYDHYKRMGFGKKTGIEFPGEQSGFINPPSNWSKQSVISLSYGYEINATLLQLACFFCMIAQDGYPVTPLLKYHTPAWLAQQPKPERVYSQRAINELKGILKETTLIGSAKKAHMEGYEIMTKTGTANLLINGQYSQDHSIYTCAGIVQKDSYKRVLIVFIKDVPHAHKLLASVIAVPLFEKIASRMIIHDQVW